MALEKNDVESIARLARLALDEDKKTALAEQLSSILDLVDQMNAIDTKDVAPVAHPLDLIARTRQDEVSETDQREKFQAIAPATENGLYLVPKVIE